MDRSFDAAKFTGETLAWFEEGEQAAANELALAAELDAEPGRWRWAFRVVAVSTIIGIAAFLVARHFELSFQLPWLS
jgi:hypothetical protein